MMKIKLRKKHKQKIKVRKKHKQKILVNRKNILMLGEDSLQKLKHRVTQYYP